MKALIIFLLASPIVAQPNPVGTNQAVSYVTNLVTAHADFRRVNGRLYNIRRSIRWTNYNVQVLTVRNNIVIGRTWTETAVYERRWLPGYVNELQRIGGAPAGPGNYGSGYHRVKIGTEKVFGQTFAITNADQGITAGSELELPLLRTGTFNTGEETLALMDCGTPNVVPVVTIITNAPPRRWSSDTVKSDTGGVKKLQFDERP